MKKIIYYVATSLDGFIAGPDADISMFVTGGNLVNRYLKDLNDFETVIMGRRTYEFGYQFGLQEGQLAYPHMEHYIFSDSLRVINQDPKLHIEKVNIEKIYELKNASKTDIYLCGGGEFAGWLLENEQIDQLKLKINPIVLGDGIPLFGSSKKHAKWAFHELQQFKEGLQIVTYSRTSI